MSMWYGDDLFYVVIFIALELFFSQLKLGIWDIVFHSCVYIVKYRMEFGKRSIFFYSFLVSFFGWRSKMLSLCRFYPTRIQ